MTLITFVVVTFAVAGLSIALRERHRPSIVVGLGGLVLAVLAAIGLDPVETTTIGGVALTVSPYLRVFLVLGSLIGLGLGIAGLAAGTRRDATAVTLAILGASALTLSVPDPGTAVVIATVGGLFGVLVTLVPHMGRAAATIGIRETRAVVVAGALAIAATAWIGRDLKLYDGQPVVFGLAYLAFAVAVAMRFGAIPFHLWAARLTDVVPETSLPILTALAPASLAVVALGWIDQSIGALTLDLAPERGVVMAVAIASIVLAAVAAFVQDDIEHMLGYSIVGDAGIIVLAMAAPSPDAWAPARLWILLFVVSRSAFAAWIAGIRTGFYTGRVADLRGWALRSPFLAVAFILIMIATIGVPGFVVFDTRASLVGLTLDGPLEVALRVAVLLPLLYYGRLLIAGLRGPDRRTEAANPWRLRITPVDVNALDRWSIATWDANRGFTTAAIALAMALLAVATAGGAFDGPAVAAERPRSSPIPAVVSPSSGPGQRPGFAVLPPS